MLDLLHLMAFCVYYQTKKLRVNKTTRVERGKIFHLIRRMNINGKHATLTLECIA